MDYTFETVNCNICKSDDYQPITNKGKFGLQTNVVLCKNCGLGYLNPRWDHDSYMKFYQHEYDHYYRPQIAKTNNKSSKQVNPIEQRLKKLKLLPEHAKNILDIGSGAGENLLHFKSVFQPCEAFAIEPSIESQVILKDADVAVIASDVDTAWNSEHREKFDFIIMRHVLEHFLDPLKIMKKVADTLSTSGIVYIAVPNNLNPTQNLEESWFRNVHTYCFNKYSLENLMNLAGLKILKLVESDEINPGEVYLIAQKSEEKRPLEFSSEHYEEQLEVYQNRFKHDNKILTKGIALARKMYARLSNS